jgi:transposase-like protein
MTPCCPKCIIQPRSMSELPRIVRGGYFYRKSDSKKIQRFRCLVCKSWFSMATFSDCFQQNKRHKNHLVRDLFCSSVSQRDIAKALNLNRTTVARKLKFLAVRARLRSEIRNLEEPKAQIIEFDDLETMEHSKLKPLSVTLAVEFGSRRILGFEVSQMAARGPMASKSVEKYGRRTDQRYRGRVQLLMRLQKLVEPDALIKSDSNPYYPDVVKKFFPRAVHQTFLSRRAAVTGQGELKVGRFDPLFSLNHTFAMFRARVNRLVRKTWCTTKKRERLADHLAIYCDFHNENLDIVKKKRLAA